MKGIKKIWLPAAFGLLFGNFFCLPVEAKLVTISTDVVNNVTAIGSLTSSAYDQLNFVENSGETLDLVPDLVPNPNVTQTITLGFANYSMNQNCKFLECSGPVSYNNPDPSSPFAPLIFSIVSEGVKQNVSLGFTWSTSNVIEDDIGGYLRVNGSLVFSPFNTTFVFHNGFDTLLITLQPPQNVIEYSNMNPNEPKPVEITALIQLLPEPSSLPLFGIGLAAWALARRRNFKLLV